MSNIEDGFAKTEYWLGGAEAFYRNEDLNLAYDSLELMMEAAKELMKTIDTEIDMQEKDIT
jgi:hypothetical protein